MPRFFIDRPIFAWVIALFILVFGGVAITQLPIAQYPTVAPPSVVISATYPGASAKTLDESVISVIEQELNGSPGLAYVESVSQANGTGSITVTFETGTNIDLAQVDVQNRLSRATPRLPAAVTQQGVKVDKSRSNVLLFVMLSSTNPAYDPVALGDYASRNILPELQRVKGIGQVQLYGTERAMRVWVDPAKLVSYGLSVAEVNAAIKSQNSLVPAGALGERPNLIDQTMTATVVVSGQLENVDQFANIVLRAKPDGSTVRLKDVARLELGGQTYGTYARLNGKPAVGMAVQLSPTGNALESAKLVKARMIELQKYFPQGVSYSFPYDTSGFIQVSISQVVETLVEAVVLVFLVMYLFLQNFRYTLIPTLVVPVALLGTFGVMSVAGFSINVLTMFGMVLAIGILVDDAIVVVENVERLMAQEGLSPYEATKKAMGQISGAIIGITVVLVSVFIPMAFFAGSVGNIYRQFSLSMVASMLFSAFLALSLTPALCATLLKSVPQDHHEKRGFFGWFNRFFTSTTHGYENWAAKLVRRGGRVLIVYVLIVGVVGWLYVRMPSAFLPNEDQGNLIVNVQLPPGATTPRTEAVIAQVEDYFMKQPEVASVVGVVGFSFSGTGQNAALGFVTLKDFDQRKGEAHSSQALAKRAFGALMGIRDAFIYPLNPPPIRELGNATGFALRLQDRGGLGHEALLAARNQLLGMARESKVVTGLRPDGLEDAPQVQLDIDREKAYALGVSFDAISSTLSTALGSSYINDFPNQARLQRVVVQVPLGVLGSLLGANLRDLPNDVFFKVGLITIIGLSAKNAILIIEFARELQSKGMSVLDATLQACHLRFRPIIMTSVAFILGVLPLVISSGAGAASQRAIGTGVMSGMIAATVLAVFFVPVFFVVVRRFFPAKPPRAEAAQTAAESQHD
ncbi:MAG: efflux RND transporter permease subunit [Aquabacterium sp.]|nr:efflux RND transporter permease subunit [Aquabacterium sp.]